MRLCALVSAGCLAATPIGLLALGASPADAHESPPGCNSNSLALTLTKDRTLVRNGDRMNYTVAVSNDAGSACDLTDATVTLTLPDSDGRPTGRTVTLATGVDYPAGTSSRVIGSVPYTVAVDPGVVDIVAEATAGGTLHDAPVDHAAGITKTLGTDVTQPDVTLTVTPTPTSGEAPLDVTYDYTLTNESSTDAPISDVSVRDDRCADVRFTGGDANGNGVLDVGEAWTYACSTTLTSGGTVVNTATATGTNTVDDLTVPIEPAQGTVRVTIPQEPSAPSEPAAPEPSAPSNPSPADTPTTGPGEPAAPSNPSPPTTPTTPVAPQAPSVLGRRQGSRTLPSLNSRRAWRDAACVSVPSRLSVRARELTVVRVRVRDDRRRADGALVRISGPGFVRRRTTDADGLAVFRVRARRSGTLVIQSDRCLGADRVAVRGARQVSGRRVPRVTG
jgi:hypothetical protein